MSELLENLYRVQMRDMSKVGAILGVPFKTTLSGISCVKGWLSWFIQRKIDKLEL
jgi:hypothetical protein